MQIIPNSFYASTPISFLKVLPEYGDTILFATATFHAIFLFGGLLSSISPHYQKLPPKKKVDWCIHLVSMVFACFGVLNGFKIIQMPELILDPLFATNDQCKKVFAIATGYFLWDTIMSIYYVNITGPAFIFHGIACFSVYFLSFQPYNHYFGGCFLLFETSTIFLNIHWFCDKMDMSGSRLQFINGLFLLAAFFFCRLIWGTYSMLYFIIVGYGSRDAVPWFVYPFYSVAAIALGTLNFYWYSLMIKSVRSRFNSQPEISKKKV
ncbi:TLC domain-containing protein [Globomyces pollinis-pini]|nr:TLC domain-containing protein [Globomyces pollinis-pini]